jgi:uncharacterized membrane protein YfcA
MATKPEVRRSPIAALLYGAPIGLVGGLIGLGGAEFRLPVLAGMFRYPARCAVALNIAISLITVVSALLIRGGTLSLAPVLGLLTVAVGVLRHRRLSSYAERAELVQTVAPMGLGSVAGAVVGGLLVALVPAAALMLVLGVILIVSAVRIFRGS